MNELEIITIDESISNGVTPSAEFKIYPKLNTGFNSSILNGKLVLEPVLSKNTNSKTFLTEKKYAGDVLMNLNRVEITPEKPIKLPLSYDNKDKLFYFEFDKFNGLFMEIIGLICYDLKIGEFTARAITWESDLHDNAKDYPYTYLAEIDAIYLKPDEFLNIENFNVILKADDEYGASLERIIKFKEIKPALSKPKAIKGANLDDVGFDSIEFYDW